MEAMASRQRDWRTRAKSLIASRVTSSRPAISRIRSSPSPFHVEPSTTRRSAPPSRSNAAREVNGGSPGHQTVTGRSWTISGVTIADEMPAGLTAGRQVDRLGAGLGRVLARQHAVRLHPRIQPRRAVWIRGLDDDGPRRVPPRECLDRGRATLRDLRPARDDHEVHHARPGGDVAGGFAVRPRWSGPAWPRSGRAPSRSRRCCGRVPTSAGPARRVPRPVRRRSARRGSDPSPALAVAGDHLVGLGRAPRPGIVVRRTRAPGSMPTGR